MVGRTTELRRLRRRVRPGAARAAPASCSRSSGRPGSASRASRPSSSARSTAPCRARPLPPLRRGDHLLAGGRGDQAAAADADRSGGRRHARRPARRRADRLVERGDRLGVPEAARDRRGRDTARLRVRRRPLGRGDLPRPDRARRRPLSRRADSPALHGPPRPARPPHRLGRRQGQRHQRAARAARARRDGAADREPRARRAKELRDRILEAAEGNPLYVEEMVAFVRSLRRRRDRPFLRRSRRCWPPGSTSWSLRAERARARRGRGPHLPPRRRPGAGAGGAAGRWRG